MHKRPFWPNLLAQSIIAFFQARIVPKRTQAGPGFHRASPIGQRSGCQSESPSENRRFADSSQPLWDRPQLREFSSGTCGCSPRLQFDSQPPVSAGCQVLNQRLFMAPITGSKNKNDAFSADEASCLFTQLLAGDEICCCCLSLSSSRGPVLFFPLITFEAPHKILIKITKRMLFSFNQFNTFFFFLSIT